MVDTVADINLGVNLVPNEKDVDKILAKLKRAKSGAYTDLKEDISKVLFSRYMMTKQATTGLGAATSFKKEFGLKLTPFQESIVRGGAGIAESGKRFVSRAEKATKAREEQEKKEKERIALEKENERERLLRQVRSYNYSYGQRDIDYESAKNKRMTKEQFAKMQQRTKYMNTGAEDLLAKIAKTDLKENEEVKKLGNNFKKYSAITLKNQKELGIKGPSFLSKFIPAVSKIPGLGMLTSLVGITALLGRAYKIADRSTVNTMKAYQAYGENEIDASRFDALAYRYGLERNDVQNMEHYGADFRARAMLGKTSPDEMLAFSLFRKAGRAAYSGGDFTSALMEDIKGLDEKQLPLARQFLSMLGLSPNLLATRKEYLAEEKSRQIDISAKEREIKAKANIGTRLEKEANEYVMGTASMSVGTVIMKVEKSITSGIADVVSGNAFQRAGATALERAGVLKTNNTNSTVVNVTNNLTVYGENTNEGLSDALQRGLDEQSMRDRYIMGDNK